MNAERDYIIRCLNNKLQDEARIKMRHEIGEKYKQVKHDYERAKFAYEQKAQSNSAIAKIEHHNTKVELKITSKTSLIDEKIIRAEHAIEEIEERRANEIDAIRKKYEDRMNSEIAKVNTRCDGFKKYQQSIINNNKKLKGIVITDLSGNIVEPEASFDEKAYTVLNKMKYDLSIAEKEYKHSEMLNNIILRLYEMRQQLEREHLRAKSSYNQPDEPKTKFDTKFLDAKTESSFQKFMTIIKEDSINSIVSNTVETNSVKTDEYVEPNTDDEVSDDTEYDSDYDFSEADMERKRNRMRRRCVIEEKRANKQAIAEAKAKVQQDKDVINGVKPSNKPKTLSLKELQERKSKTQK